MVFELNFAGDGAYAFLGPYVINSGWCPGKWSLFVVRSSNFAGACRYGLGSKGCWGGMVCATNVSLLVVFELNFAGDGAYAFGTWIGLRGAKGMQRREGTIRGEMGARGRRTRRIGSVGPSLSAGTG